jgi:hypothetical protein
VLIRSKTCSSKEACCSCHQFIYTTANQSRLSLAHTRLTPSGFSHTSTTLQLLNCHTGCRMYMLYAAYAYACLQEIALPRTLQPQPMHMQAECDVCCICTCLLQHSNHNRCKLNVMFAAYAHACSYFPSVHARSKSDKEPNSPNVVPDSNRIASLTFIIIASVMGAV